MTDKNCVKLYVTIYLKIPNDVTKAARPSRITVDTQVMLACFDVNGLAMEASASDKLIPAWAALTVKKLPFR